MKARYYIIAIAALIAGACSRNADLIEEDIQQITFTAYQEGYDAPTKTTVLEGGTQVYWEANDEVKLFYNGVGSRFTSTNTEPVGVAQFTGSLSTVIGFNEGFSNDNPLWGLYPYRADATSDGASVTTTLPAEQSGRAGSFAKNTHITLGRSTSLSMGFYAVSGGVRFSLTQEGIKRVTFEGNNGEAIAGKIKIAFVDGVPVVQEVTEDQTVIKLTVPGGGTFQTGQWYYISAIPGTLSGGFTMTFYKESESAKLISSSSVKIKRGIFGSMANADKDLVFKNTNAVGEIVDLGLSVKWASWNLGASSPEEYGDYFAWGETEGKVVFDWTNYSLCNGSATSLTKYNTKSTYGTVDNKTTLESEDDAAHVKWGGSWRMPTDEEWKELRENCTWTWTSDYNGTGVAGRIVTSKKVGYTDKSIFLPATGYKYGTSHDHLGTGGEYWSATISKGSPHNAYCSDFSSSGVGYDLDKRCNGRTVRPVCSESDFIQFADPIAKYACVEKFDSNGDGEVSYAEAAAATSLSGLFTNWDTVTLFDEIKYFTGVTSTEGVFDGLTKLKHITIPDWITTLGSFSECTALDTVELPAALPSLPSYCFEDCVALKKVTLPTGITSIPSYCFRWCSALESIAIPSTVTSIGHQAFRECTLLSGVELPSGLKSIGDDAFEDCKAIASVVFPTTLTSIGQYAFSNCTALTSVSIGSGVSVGQFAFRGCSNLVSVVLPKDMTAIPNGCFNGCSALSTIVWPEALTTIGDSALAGCRFKNAELTQEIPATVTTIGSYAFRGIKHLIIPSASPVNIASNSFISGYTFIYVPSNMVEMYKVRTNWNYYADYIKPISDYPFIPQGEAVGGTVGEAIDLGLSVKWASWNVGASAPEDYGAFFAWGETEPKTDYSWSTYIWCNGSSNSLTMYNTRTNYGFVDNLTTLDSIDDAAHINWSGTWRMPTDAEWTELRDNCTWTWTSDFNNTGIAGRIVTSKKSGYTDKSIFLPAAGYRSGSNLSDVGSWGFYWSSSLNTGSPCYAWLVHFNSGSVYRDDNSRLFGRSVRPVCE